MERTSTAGVQCCRIEREEIFIISYRHNGMRFRKDVHTALLVVCYWAGVAIRLGRGNQLLLQLKKHTEYSVE